MQKRIGVVMRTRLFHLLTDGPLSISTSLDEPALMVGWPILPANECCALPTLSPVSTFHIRYNTNAEPLHSHSRHILPAVSCSSPLTAGFTLFFHPYSTKCGPRLGVTGQKSLSRLVTSWHSKVLSMQEDLTGRET